MGKADKKIKSDRINVLRKQYDAFIEEDKRRRERNEYILGKLDKMRVNTAIVLRSRVNKYGFESPVAMYDRSNNLEDPQPHVQHIATPLRNQSLVPVPSYNGSFLDEGLILQEISKKYILIPKLRPTPLEHELTKHNVGLVSEENDWKSKYDILAQLKRDEKGFVDANSPNCASTVDKKAEENVNLVCEEKQNLLKSRKPIPEPNIYHSEIPEKVISVNIKNISKVSFDDNANESFKVFESTNDVKVLNDAFETLTTEEKIEQEATYATIPKTKKYNEPPNHQNGNNVVVECQEKNQEDVIYANVTIAKKHANQNECFEGHIKEKKTEVVLSSVNYVEPIEDNAIHDESRTDVNIYQTDNETPQIQMNKDGDSYYQENVPLEQAPEYQQLENADNTLTQGQHYENVYYSNENNDNPVQKLEIDHVYEEINEPSQAVDDGKQEFSTSNIPMDNKEYQQSENIVLGNDGIVPLENVQTYLTSANDDTTVIQPDQEQTSVVTNVEQTNENSIVTTQIEAFEEENHGMFYTENPAENYEQYNTEPGETSNTEYPVQPETYDPNAQYDYYENIQDQGYPAEYVENDETLQQYDQSYAQQYSEMAYDEQQPQTGQYEQQQAVVDTNMYEQLEPLEQEQSPVQDIEHLEQVLDTEEGYVPIVTEKVHETQDGNETNVEQPPEPANIS